VSYVEDPSSEDVANRIARDFAPSECAQVATILNKVTELGWSVPWVQLAILRLANGRLSLLQQWVDQANKDQRDLKLSVESVAGPFWEREFILYESRRR
jgi:hypothetical protein